MHPTQNSIQIQKIEILAFSAGKTQWIALSPVCTALGIDWPEQRESLRNDGVLNSLVRTLRTVTAEGKAQERICLPLEVIPLWLAGIDVERVKSDLGKEIVSGFKTHRDDLCRSIEQKEAISREMNHLFGLIKGAIQVLGEDILVEQQVALALNEQFWRLRKVLEPFLD